MPPSGAAVSRDALRTRGREAMIAAQVADPDKFARSTLRARGEAVLASVQSIESIGGSAGHWGPMPESFEGAHGLAAYGSYGIPHAWPQGAPWSCAGPWWPGYMDESWTTGSGTAVYDGPHAGAHPNSASLASTAAVASAPCWEVPMKVYVGPCQHAGFGATDENVVSLADVLPPPGL